MLSSSMGVVLNARRARREKLRVARSSAPASGTAIDLEQRASLAAFTARSLRTASPRPFGASIVHTKSGEVLLRVLNMVKQEIDPSSHAEVGAIRLATKRLKQISLAGYTL